MASLALAALPLAWAVAARAQRYGMGLGIGAGDPALARYVTAGDEAFLLGEPELLPRRPAAGTAQLPGDR